MKLFYLLVAGMLLLQSCMENTKKSSFDIIFQVKNDSVYNEKETTSVVTLKNTGSNDLPSNGWALYYNKNAKITIPPKFNLTNTHVNGDLQKIEPTPEFVGIKAGDSLTFDLITKGKILNQSDIPGGFFIVIGKKAIGCDLTVSKFTLRDVKVENRDIMPVCDAEETYNNNLSISVIDKESIVPILPTPENYKYLKGEIILKDTIVIGYDKQFSNETQILKNRLGNVFSGTIITREGSSGNINLLKSTTFLNKEGYSLVVNNNKIIAKASTPAGVFYATSSIVSLLPVDLWKNKTSEIKLKNIEITDAPRFEYRGIMIDVARNFKPKSEILKTLDLMSVYKLNKLHFHIADDEGWRLEIPGLPELTEFGGYRGYSENESEYLYPSFRSGASTSTPGSGFYTKADYVEILKFAKARHIEVIPEIDMPGHARAAIRSMQVRYNKYLAQGDTAKAIEFLISDPADTSNYMSVQGWSGNVVNVAGDGIYNFIDKITDELLQMYAEAGLDMKTMHIGGDETPSGVWTGSPQCSALLSNDNSLNAYHDLYSYFINKITDILKNKGLTAAGWEEIAMKSHGKVRSPEKENNLQPYVWNSMWGSGSEDLGYKLANEGYPVVLTHVTNMYFDLAYVKNPEEIGLYWGGYVDTKKTWEYTPFDLSKCAYKDAYGQTIDADSMNNAMVHLNNKGVKNIVGIQGSLWGENTPYAKEMEYLLVPKLLGLSERAWAQQPEWAKQKITPEREAEKAKEWNLFVNRIAFCELPKLDYYNGGYYYRITPPGAIIKDGKLYANTLYSELTIRYTTDGTEPTENSEIYKAPVNVTNGIIKLRSFTDTGRGSRTVVLQN